MTTKATALFLALIVLISSGLPAGEVIYTCSMSGRQYKACCCTNQSDTQMTNCHAKMEQASANSEEKGCCSRKNEKPSGENPTARASHGCGCCSVSHVEKNNNPARTVEDISAPRPVLQKSLNVDLYSDVSEQFITRLHRSDWGPPNHGSPPTYLRLLQIRR